MRIIDVPTPGGPDALRMAERPVPAPNAQEVLIKVAAAGVNRADILQRLGSYPSPPGAPENPGLEVSGIVEAVGSNVREFKPGDPVCALLQGGGYAEYCVAPTAQVLPVPVGISLVAAAAIPEAYFTVFSNLLVFGALKAGESLLVHGGTSGIGVTAIQLASATGATVFATAGSEEKCRICRTLGAELAINYRQADFVAQILQHTKKRGVNVVLDMVAGQYTARNIDVLADEGRLITIATQGGASVTINIGMVMSKRAILTGSTLRPRSTSFKQSIKDRLLSEVWPLLGSGRLRIIVDRTFDFGAVADAHRYMDSGVHVGKILLTVS